MSRNRQGLYVPTTGIVAFLRYLWSIPVVRQIAGWVIQEVITVIFNYIRKERKKTI